MMFTQEQVLHYKTFGYVIMRNVFSSDETKKMRDEFTVAEQREPRSTTMAGRNSYSYHIVLGDDTPHLAALTEEERLYGPAKQVLPA